MGGAGVSEFLFTMNPNLKLENCVCKTQVMPPCPKPVLTPCPILTHDPQHIHSILETNVKVKIAAILSKIIFFCAKKKKKKKKKKNRCTSSICF